MVDLGCGFGGLTSLLHPGNFLVGVDRDRSKLLPFVDPETPRVQAEAERLPFKDSSLDAVVAVSLLEHVADQASLLREVGRVLRPQGRVILQIPELRFPFEPHTKWPLLFAWKPSLQKRILQSTNYSDLNLATSPDKLRELALAAGFEMGEWIPIWHFAAARVLRMPMGYFSVLTKP